MPTKRRTTKKTGTAKAEADKAPEPEEKKEDEGHKNRHHRRLEAKLQAEREANIHLNARVQALTEAAKFNQEFGAKTLDERLVTLYGDDENGKKAALITQSLLADTAKSAREQALEDFRETQRKEAQEVKESEQFIDGQLEELEDEHGIDLTSNAPAARKARSEFLGMVEKFSPKDEDGNVAEFADFSEVFDVFQKTRERPTNTRQKDLASRGQVRSGSSSSKVEDIAGEKFLKDAGII